MFGVGKSGDQNNSNTTNDKNNTSKTTTKNCDNKICQCNTAAGGKCPTCALKTGGDFCWIHRNFCPCWCSKCFRRPCWSYYQQANMTS